MDQFDLIGALNSYATSKGWKFLYGDNFNRNYQASKNTYTAGMLILGADPFIAKPVYSEYGKITQIEYSGLVMLGRKLEATTSSKLDETYLQKYNNRLKELSGTLSTNLIAFACANSLTISSAQFELSINNLDANIDFVIASVTLIQV